jgi:hypothetical protein
MKNTCCRLCQGEIKMTQGLDNKISFRTQQLIGLYSMSVYKYCFTAHEPRELFAGAADDDTHS